MLARRAPYLSLSLKWMLFVGLGVGWVVGGWMDVSDPPAMRAAKLVAEMTLEEKIAMVRVCLLPLLSSVSPYLRCMVMAVDLAMLE